MKTQELRLGNFVTPNGVIEFEDALDGFVHHIMGPSARLAVCAILSEKIIAVEAEFRGRMFQQKIDIDDVASIPLTEELLLKLGFTKELSQFNDYDYTLFPFTVFFDRGNYVFKFQYLRKGVGGSFTKVETLHHLQNLFFELTGEELDVKF